MLPCLLLPLLGIASGLGNRGPPVYIPVQHGETVRVWCQGRVVDFPGSTCRSNGACYRDFSYRSNLPVRLVCTDRQQDKNLTIGTTVTREAFRSANIEVLSETSVRIKCLVSTHETKLNLDGTYPLMRWASNTRGTTGDISSNQYNWVDYYYLEAVELSGEEDYENCNGTIYSHEMFINSDRFTTRPWGIISEKITTETKAVPEDQPPTSTVNDPLPDTDTDSDLVVVGLSGILIGVIATVISVTVLLVCICLICYFRKTRAAAPAIVRSPSATIRPVYPTSLNEPLVGIVRPPPPDIDSIPNMPLYNEIEIYDELGTLAPGHISVGTPVPPMGYETSLRLTPSPTPYTCPDEDGYDSYHPHLGMDVEECENEYAPLRRTGPPPSAPPGQYSQLNAPAPHSSGDPLYEYAQLPTSPGRVDDGYRYNVLRRDGTDDENYQYNVLRRN